MVWSEAFVLWAFGTSIGAQHMPTPEIMKQMLTSPYLADKPLLFTKGQTVFHKEFGICKVDLALGARNLCHSTVQVP